MQRIASIVILLGCFYGVYSRTICLNNCEDKSDFCSLSISICSSNFFVRYMCPLTCDVCSKCGGEAARRNLAVADDKPCEIGTCRDLSPSYVCATYRRNRYACALYGSNCLLTCGLCTNCALPPTEKPCSHDCNDSHDSCEYWKREGFCNARRGYPETRTACPLSCEECTPCPTTTAADYTTTDGLPPTSPAN